jgi:hypothetical protein
MIAMPLAYPKFLEPETAKPLVPPTLFQPIDPGVVSASIPTFFVGRDRDGFWLARDVKGQQGGAFVFKNSALAFARQASRPLGCAIVFPSERFELDIENQGNPLVPCLRPLVRLVRSASAGRSGDRI